MSQTLSEYRKGRTKVVTLPSGLELTLRKAPGIAFLEVGLSPLFNLSTEGKISIENTEQLKSMIGDVKLSEFIKQTVCSTSYKPKIVVGDVPENDEETMSISEFDLDDLLALVGHCVELNGIGKKKEFFREAEGLVDSSGSTLPTIPSETIPVTPVDS